MEFFVEIIKEKDFVPLANKASHNMLTYSNYLLENRHKQLSKKFFVTCVKESIELEDFLDDHGARNNKIWVYFGELVASIRNFSSTAYIISHILSRIKFYKLDNKKSVAFVKEAQKRLSFLQESIFALFSHLQDEAKNLGLTIPTAFLDESCFEEHLVVKSLPQNINDEGGEDIHGDIARVATELINAFNESGVFLFNRKVAIRNLDISIIPEKINEETLRHLEAHVHNSQSMYDTYIQKTPIEAEHPVLKSLRGHISVTLHLLGVARSLSHFFERHETSIRQEATRKKIAKIIQQKKVLDVIINFALYYYTAFIHDGQKCAHEILDKFTIVESRKVKVPEGLGFHLRPSTLVAKIANHYGSKLTMLVNNNEFDASSVIDIMWAGGMIKKEGITEVEFQGDKNAIRDVEVLASVNYGEDTIGNSTPLPDELTYLRHD